MAKFRPRLTEEEMADVEWAAETLRVDRKAALASLISIGVKNLRGAVESGGPQGTIVGNVWSTQDHVDKVVPKGPPQTFAVQAAGPQGTGTSLAHPLLPLPPSKREGGEERVTGREAARLSGAVLELLADGHAERCCLAGKLEAMARSIATAAKRTRSLSVRQAAVLDEAIAAANACKPRSAVNTPRVERQRLEGFARQFGVSDYPLLGDEALAAAVEKARWKAESRQRETGKRDDYVPTALEAAAPDKQAGTAGKESK